MTFGDLKSSTSSTSSSVPGSPASGRSLKIVWQEEIRRLPFNAASGDLQALKELCASCFVIKNLAGLVFTYEDSEGDTVTLSTIEELREIVESSPVTIKLNLQRKINKAKPQQQQQPQPVVVPTKETSAAPQPIAVEVIQPEQSQPEKKKNLRKERKQQLKKEIVHSKVVRIRWRTAAPETSTTETPINNKEKKDKGCYVSVNLKGKVKFGACAQSPNGLWLMHELSTGEIIFAPLSSPNCCLRVFADGRINLTQGGAGPRTRWNLIKAQDQTALPLNSLGATERVQFASRFVPGLNLAVIQEFNRKNKPALHPKGVNASSTATVLTSEFTIEVQDPMVSLVKFAKNVAAKKKAIKNVLKRKEEQDEEAYAVGEKKMNKNKFNKLNKEKAADNNGNGKVKNNNKNKNKDPNWASMTKQQRLEAKAARKLEKLEQKRLKMALKKKM